MAGIHASIVVCTYDRPASLKRTLRSLVRQKFPTGELEIIVVDNSRERPAREAVSDIHGDHSIRYLLEPAIGLSRARNRGLVEASGDIVLFIDDDATATDMWASWMSDPFVDSDVWAVGGRIELVTPNGDVARLSRPERRMLSELDLGPQRRTMNGSQIPFGTNMAVRRRKLLEVGGFDTRLGRRGPNLISNEELEAFQRLRNAGGTIVYEPRAAIHHHIAPERLRSRWLLGRAFAQGRSDYLTDRIAGTGRNRRYGPAYPFGLLKRCGYMWESVHSRRMENT